MKTRYDFVCSLGGSCATAKQLMFKGLREESLPFDWLFHLDDRPLQYLEKAFRTNFDDFLLLENLRELSPSERGDSECFQYRDEISGYNFIHDFHSKKEKSYDDVIKKYKRRIERLENKLFQSKDVLFILDARYNVDTYLLQKIKKNIYKKYRCNVDIVLIQFNHTCNNFYTDNDINVHCYMRNHTSDDYNREPEEYDFMRKIKLRHKHTCIDSIRSFFRRQRAKLINILDKR